MAPPACLVSPHTPARAHPPALDFTLPLLPLEATPPGPGTIAVLLSRLLSRPAEDDVALLAVDILAHPGLEGRELGDVGVVADVDGAVGAAQQFLPLHSLQALLRPDALEAGLLVQSGCSEVNVRQGFP